MNWKTIAAYLLAGIVIVFLLAGSVAYYVRLGEVLWNAPARIDAVEAKLKDDDYDIKSLDQRVGELEGWRKQHGRGQGQGAAPQ